MRVLAVVLAAVLLAGCGGDDKTNADCSNGSDTHFAVYRASEPVTPAAIEQTLRDLCDRAGRAGRDDLMITREGDDRIKVGAAKPLEAELLRYLGSDARLQFLDWEASLKPRDQTSPTLNFLVSVETAAEQKPAAEPTDVPPDGPSQAVMDRFGGDVRKIEAHYDRENDTTGDKYYVFGPGRGFARDLIPPGGPGVPTPPNAATAFYDSRAEIGDPPPGSRVVKVPRGIAVVKDAQGPSGGQNLGYWVVEDDTELSGADIRDPKQAFDSQTNEPIVEFEFSEQGQKAFARVTKRLAERGAQITAPPGTDPQATFQRFAIALDGQLVSLATIDHRANPEGIDGSSGAQINGIGSAEETRNIATLLALGPLPLDLTLVELR
jgi:SecD/SecF fusion protein